MTSSSRKLGVHNPAQKLQPLLSQERVKPRTSNLANTFRISDGPSEQKPTKNFGEKGAWATVQIFWDTPYYLRNG